MPNPIKKMLGRLLGWAVKKGVEEAEKELDKQRERATGEGVPRPR